MFYLNVKQMNRLVRIIEDCHATPQLIATALNSSEKIGWSVLKGRAQISNNDARRICERFGINYCYVSTGTEPMYLI